MKKSKYRVGKHDAPPHRTVLPTRNEEGARKIFITILVSTAGWYDINYQVVQWIRHDQPAGDSFFFFLVLRKRGMQRGQPTRLLNQSRSTSSQRPTNVSLYVSFSLVCFFFSTSFFVLHFRLRETVVYKVSLREAREVLWRHLLATCKKESCTSRPRPIGTNTSTGATSSAEATSLYIIRSTYYTPATPIHWKRQKWRTKKNKNKSKWE